MAGDHGCSAVCLGCVPWDVADISLRMGAALREWLLVLSLGSSPILVAAAVFVAERVCPAALLSCERTRLALQMSTV